ncbi:threonine aldolase family protein [Idiomarina aminovorans]|uniref:threonine aldolase family protein n=1 Tax=Idiomarina aminovorans TaxID=2914829 RepID=UPI002005D47B|nr:beta-eliminating lyase-related protein [Idiomarina sp. ATCH4]MCK7459878.1 beta-eliminating lyase-related protein [Idiomarina sp. ATCH4]
MTLSISAKTKQAYHHAAEQANASLLRQPQLSMADELRLLAEQLEQNEKRDTYGSGKLINDFEDDVATLLGKPAALFLPTGTLAQPLALRIHADDRQKNGVALHPTSHLMLHEQMGFEALWQLNGTTTGFAEKPLTLSDLKSVQSNDLAACLLELPMREIGGQLPEWDDLVEQSQWARQHNIAMHLDGARLWQVPTAYDCSMTEVCELFDSVYVSFYKDLGALSGAVLAGSEAFIEQAKIWARRAGGNIITQYPQILSAHYGLRENLPVLPDAVHYAKTLGKALNDLDDIRVNPETPQVAMFHLHFKLTAEQLSAKVTNYIGNTGVVILPLPRAEKDGEAICEISIGRNAMSKPQSYWLRHFKAFLETL